MESDLSEYLARMHIDSEEICHKILNSILQDTEARKKMSNFKVSRRRIFAFFTQVVLCQENCPRLMHEIAHSFHVSVSDLLAVQKELELPIPHCPPIAYNHRICANLQLPFKIERAISSVLELMEHELVPVENIFISIFHEVLCRFDDRLKHYKSSYAFSVEQTPFRFFEEIEMLQKILSPSQILQVFQISFKSKSHALSLVRAKHRSYWRTRIEAKEVLHIQIDTLFEKYEIFTLRERRNLRIFTA